MRCILWPEQFAEFGAAGRRPTRSSRVRGAIDRRPAAKKSNLIVNELIPLDQLDSRYTSGIVIRIDEREHGADTLDKVREIVRAYPGNSELQLAVDPGRRQPRLPQVAPRPARSHELQDRLDDLLGPGNLQLLTTPPKPSANATAMAAAAAVSTQRRAIRMPDGLTVPSGIRETRSSPVGHPREGRDSVWCTPRLPRRAGQSASITVAARPSCKYGAESFSPPQRRRPPFLGEVGGQPG